MADQDTDELAQYLDALRREDCYRVDEVLKESPHEITQRVSFVGANGAERGPYVRKFIKREAGMGAVYERIFAAQQAGRRFRHVPAILECYERGGELVVVMEHVRGETLQDYIYRVDPSAEVANTVFPMLCDAATELHEEFDPPIIHRDLKPSNVILSDGGLTIIDFGIAREYRVGAEDDTAHFGTRAFAPPEQFGYGQTTVRSDVYALGMLLYFCLTETIPASNAREAGFADPSIPGPLRDVIEQATAFAPESRFASAAALKNAFLVACDLAVRGANARGDARGDARKDASTQPRPQAVSEPGRVAGASPHSLDAPCLSGRDEAAPASVAIGSRAQDADPPQILGRIWNVLVIAATVGLCIAMGAWAVGVISNPPEGAAYADRAPVLLLALAADMLLFLLVGFACLDKRRIRARVPAFANVRWWQVWGVVLIAYILVVAMGRALGVSGS